MAATLAQLRTRSQARSDITGGHVSTTTWLAWINEAVMETWDLIVGAYGDHFFTTADFTLTSTATGNSYTLASDFYMTLAVEIYPATSQRQFLKRFVFGEKNALGELSYREMGAKMYVEPYEQAAGSYRIYYVPLPTALAADGDTINAQIAPWDEYVVLCCAIKARQSEESDTAELEQSRARMEARIKRMAVQRDQGQPDKVRDINAVVTLPWLRAPL